MYSLIALLAGVAKKLYDDLEDNNFLQKFRNNTLMEFLKGIHYIAFTATSVEEPMFFIVQYFCNIVHSFGNKEGYSKPYDNSVLYSFLLLFIIIDYKKITSLHLSDKLISIFYVFLFAIEPLIGSGTTVEYSFTKMIGRVSNMIIHIILCYFIRSNSLKYITVYFIGYSFISVLVQLYSLSMEKLKEKEVKEEVKEEEIEEEKEEEIEEKVKEEVKEEKEEVKEKEKKVVEVVEVVEIKEVKTTK
jgi:hypothetical protein